MSIYGTLPVPETIERHTVSLWWVRKAEDVAVTRAMWKGVVEMRGASLPVRLYAAVQDRAVHFHLLDTKSKSRVKQHMVDPETGKDVPSERVHKGLEVRPGVFVELAPEDLVSLRPKPSRSIEIGHFVPAGHISQQWYERPYYLGPDGDAKKYFALAQALEKTGREGLARWVMRGHQYLGALRSRDGYLLLITLRYSEEVLSAAELPKPRSATLDPREVKMAEQLIGMLEGEFNPNEVHDEYRERVMKYIEEKAQGKTAKLAAVPRKKPAASLTNALAASLKAARARKEQAVA